MKRTLRTASRLQNAWEFVRGKKTHENPFERKARHGSAELLSSSFRELSKMVILKRVPRKFCFLLFAALEFQILKAYQPTPNILCFSPASGTLKDKMPNKKD
jgi:hypothetical protein